MLVGHEKCPTGHTDALHVDCCKRNDNKIKDVTLFPDQDQIQMDISRVKYCSKIDLLNAYEQVQIESEDVWKIAFTTIYGTFIS